MALPNDKAGQILGLVSGMARNVPKSNLDDANFLVGVVRKLRDEMDTIKERQHDTEKSLFSQLFEKMASGITLRVDPKPIRVEHPPVRVTVDQKPVQVRMDSREMRLSLDASDLKEVIAKQSDGLNKLTEFIKDLNTQNPALPGKEPWKKVRFKIEYGGNRIQNIIAERIE